MITVKVKNTYNIKIKGTPSSDLQTINKPKTVALQPCSIPFIKPKLCVKEGDQVQIGSPVFLDKLCPELVFTSPAAGEISKIKLGKKRRIEEVVIKVAANEKALPFKKMISSEMESVKRDDLVKNLVDSGMWTLFKEQPYRRIPSPSSKPKNIVVSIDNDEAFLPQSNVFLKGAEKDFNLGIKALKTLAQKEVFVGVAATNHTVKTQLKESITHQIKGKYPANDPGVLHYYIKKSQEDNKDWIIKGQDVVLLGQFLNSGMVPTEKVITISGSKAKQPKHIKTRIGVSIDYLLSELNEESSDAIRYISGGILTGSKVAKDGFIGVNDQALNMIPEGSPKELLYFMRPGFQKPTFSKTYLSALLPLSKFEMGSELNGGERACIACGECPQVCPVGLLPQFIYKSLNAGDVEEAVDFGLLDCVECGLCSYVCPSKIELASDLTEAKRELEKEVPR